MEVNIILIITAYFRGENKFISKRFCGLSMAYFCWFKVDCKMKQNGIQVLNYKILSKNVWFILPVRAPPYLVIGFQLLRQQIPVFLVIVYSIKARLARVCFDPAPQIWDVKVCWNEKERKKRLLIMRPLKMCLKGDSAFPIRTKPIKKKTIPNKCWYPF